MISDEVRAAIDNLLNMALEVGGFNLNEWDIVKDCLDSLPKTPEPPWADAPDWAAAHVFTTMGFGTWIYPVPRMAEYSLTFGGWICDGDRNQIQEEKSGLRLPIGIDWRTTLRRRPGVIKED